MKSLAIESQGLWRVEFRPLVGSLEDAVCLQQLALEAQIVVLCLTSW